MRMPAMLWPGEICWTTVRNHREDPTHSAEHGAGKPRPGILVCQSGKTWLVIGTTSKDRFADGTPRVRIPSEHWEDLHPGLPRRAGDLWGRKVQFVPVADIGEHIGTASPALRALSVRDIENLDRNSCDEFARPRPDEIESGQPDATFSAGGAPPGGGCRAR